MWPWLKFTLLYFSIVGVWVSITMMNECPRCNFLIKSCLFRVLLKFQARGILEKVNLYWKDTRTTMITKKTHITKICILNLKVRKKRGKNSTRGVRDKKILVIMKNEEVKKLSMSETREVLKILLIYKC